ncbi:hypothetical protein PsYK624_052300 [Phanerochaete sordida]|uniref:Uncharacterized protein n=1 Tax=Phanerochaete sordida TaxID=48140 RepID=A0A9P3G6G1_9APHY|nr:hypothetical protein PsYK624_052300 [Phanerochaete sordida]
MRHTCGEPPSVLIDAQRKLGVGLRQGVEHLAGISTLDYVEVWRDIRCFTSTRLMATYSKFHTNGPWNHCQAVISMAISTAPETYEPRIPP